MRVWSVVGCQKRRLLIDRLLWDFCSGERSFDALCDIAAMDADELYDDEELTAGLCVVAERMIQEKSLQAACHFRRELGPGTTWPEALVRLAVASSVVRSYATDLANDDLSPETDLQWLFVNEDGDQFDGDVKLQHLFLRDRA